MSITRRKGTDTYFVVKGSTYSTEPKYYSWDDKQMYPYYEELEKFEWIPDGITSITEGELWLLENHPDCYMGGSIYEQYADSYTGEREPLDFCVLAVPSYYEAVYQTTDRNAILKEIEAKLLRAVEEQEKSNKEAELLETVNNLLSQEQECDR